MEEKRNDVDEGDLEEKHSKTKKEASYEIPQKELKLNKKREVNICGGYGSRSRLSKKRQKKSAWELKKNGSKSYNIRALLQQSQDLGILSFANSPDGLDCPSELLPNDHSSSALRLSDVLRRGASSYSRQ